MRWAGTYPDRVGRLVLANTAPRFTDAIRAARMKRVESHRGQPYFEDAIEALQAHQEGRYSTDAELSGLYQREWLLFAPLEADASLVLGAISSAGNNADALRHFNDHVAAGMDQRALLAGVAAPTLVISGELDPFGEAPAREIAEALPDATLVVLPGADHFIFLEPTNRRPWSRAVLEFLAG